MFGMYSEAFVADLISREKLFLFHSKLFLLAVLLSCNTISGISSLTSTNSRWIKVNFSRMGSSLLAMNDPAGTAENCDNPGTVSNGVEQVSHLGVTTGVGCSAGETPVRCDVGATLASNGAHAWYGTLGGTLCGSRNLISESLQGCYTLWGSPNWLCEALQGFYMLYRHLNSLTKALQDCYTLWGSENGLLEALQGCYTLCGTRNELP